MISCLDRVTRPKLGLGFGDSHMHIKRLFKPVNEGNQFVDWFAFVWIVTNQNGLTENCCKEKGW